MVKNRRTSSFLEKTYSASHFKPKLLKNKDKTQKHQHTHTNLDNPLGYTNNVNKINLQYRVEGLAPTAECRAILQTTGTMSGQQRPLERKADAEGIDD